MYLIMIMLSCLMVMVIYVLFLVVFEKVDGSENIWSPFECGFDPRVETRKDFSYKFFLISVMFLIFDVEIALLLPVPFMEEFVMMQWLFLWFMVMLLVGILYEVRMGVLKWVD